MAATKPKVGVTRKPPEPVERRMAELFDVELNASDAPFDHSALAGALSRADVVAAPAVTDRIDAELLAGAEMGERGVVDIRAVADGHRPPDRVLAVPL